MGATFFLRPNRRYAVLVLAVAIAATSAPAALEAMVIGTARDSAALLIGPGAAEISVGSVARGQKVVIVGQRDGWLRVQALRGEGWIPASKIDASAAVQHLPERLAMNRARLNLRAAPFVESIRLALIAENTVLEIWSAEDGWLQVRAGDQVGWVAAEHVEEVTSAQAESHTVAAQAQTQESAAAAPTFAAGVTLDNVNLRAAPSVDAERLATLPRATRVRILGESAGWLQIEAVGTRGWVASDFVALSAPDPPDTPVAISQAPELPAKAPPASAGSVPTKTSPAEPATRPAAAQPAAVSHEGRTLDRLNLRAEPSREGARLATLQRSTRLRILGESEGWLRVEANGRTGWVAAAFVERAPSASGTALAALGPGAGRTLDNLNLRTEPALDGERVVTLPAGSRLRIVDEIDGWLEVEAGGFSGWVSALWVERGSARAVEPVRLAAGAAGAAPDDETIEVESSPLATGSLIAPASERPAADTTVAATDELRADPTIPEIKILQTHVNRRFASSGVMARRRADGGLLMPRAFLEGQRLDVARLGSPVEIDGELFHDLTDAQDILYYVEESSQELYLEADGAAFTESSLDLDRSRFAPPSASSPGLFVDYDLSATSLSERDLTGGGIVELGYFSKWGLVSAEVAASDALGGLRRLRTSWSRDFPRRMWTLEIGDSQSRAGVWYNGARFGGIQWRSNFTTQPGFLPFSLPSFDGQVETSSEFELYVNEILRAREALEPGPFRLHNLPALTGSGSYRLVVRDVLGREVTHLRDFYVTPSLLRPGLREFSHNLGAIRSGLGPTDEYGDLAYVGTERFGVNKIFTLEARAELEADRALAGIGGAIQLGRVGVGNLTVARSRGDAHSGSLLSYGLDHQGNRVSFGFSEQLTNGEFSQLGLARGSFAARRSRQARVSVPLSRGSVSLAYSRRDQPQRDFRSLSLNFGLKLDRRTYLSVSGLSSTVGGLPNDSVFLHLTRSLGPFSSTHVGLTGDGSGEPRLRAGYQKTSPDGNGDSFSVVAEAGEASRLIGHYETKTRVGSLVARGAALGESTALRLNLRGAMALMGGKLAVSRPTRQSFGLVSTQGIPAVRVYHQNRLVGRTDSRGLLLVPSFLPYQENKVRIEEKDLPLWARAESLETTVSPYARSGVRVDFPIDTSRSALVAVIDEDGQPLAPGTEVRSVDGEGRFPVAYRGQVYLTDLSGPTVFAANVDGETCRFVVVPPEERTLEEDLGTVTCEKTEPSR